MAQELSADEIRLLLRGFMGLIIGPEATLGIGGTLKLASNVAETLKVDAEEQLLRVTDRASKSGVARTQISETIESAMLNSKPPGSLASLAKIRWSAVLSLAIDSNLESLLQAEVSKNPLRSPILTVDDFDQVLPNAAVPSFKLLGSLSRQTVPLTRSEYLKRRASWRHAIRDFTDHVKGSPVLCLGLDPSDESLLDLFGEICGDRGTAPPFVVLSADDPLRNNADFLALLEDRTQILILRGSLGELSRAVQTAAKHGFSVGLPFPVDSNNPLACLTEFDGLAITVNNRLKSSLQPSETHRLHDILFSPDAPLWDAHVHGLDLPRTLTDVLNRKIAGRIVQRTFREGVCVVKGAAASGKTMIIKRLAYDLAAGGEIVLWMRPHLDGDSFRRLKKLMESVAAADDARRRRVVCVVDDPLEMGALSARDIARAARDAGLAVMVVLGIRSAEFALENQEIIFGDLPIEIEEAVTDDLDENEWSRLPEYLVKVGVAANAAAAKIIVDNATVRHTRDTLSLLYWLLPATKASIAQSVRNEYFRLGDRAGFSKMLIAGVKHTSELLRQSYELVAVAAHYGVALPIELLVRALGVDYGPWLDAAKSDGPAWGLLYDEMSDDGQTVCYRTRNDVVTSTMINAMNGGTLVKTGETARLRLLIDSCAGRGGIVYQQFCVHVLVNNSRLQDLDYESGIDLYNRALKALPHPDKTLVHHKGLWIRKHGNQPEEAEKVLLDAIATPNYPYAAQKETDEHIYTSLAANVIDRVDTESLSLEDGKDLVAEYLRKANRLGGLNSRAVHVQGKLVLRLLPKMVASPDTDSVELLERTLADIDRALLILKNPIYYSSGTLEDVQYLEDVRDRLWQGWLSTEDFERRAQELWEQYHHQGGFVLAARQRFRFACQSNKGTDFNSAATYCRERMAAIEEKKEVVSPQLHEILVHILYKWRVQRHPAGNVDHSIDWDELLEHSSRVIRSPEMSRHAMSVYIHSLALCHQGQWARAEEYFRQMRQAGIAPPVLWEPRDYLLTDTATRRLLQGTLKEGPTRDFFFSDDLQMDFVADRRSKWEQPGLVDFAYIEFSFGGPKAVDRHVGLL